MEKNGNFILIKKNSNLKVNLISAICHNFE